MSKRSWKILTANAVLLIIGCCAFWQISNSKISGLVVEQKVKGVLKSHFDWDLTNSWHTVSAAGGMVGSPFTSARWWREYFLLVEGDHKTLENISTNLAARKWVNITYLPLGYASGVMNHPHSAELAPWWQPETNSEPMFMYAGMNYGGIIVHAYAFKKTTNALLYFHLAEY